MARPKNIDKTATEEVEQQIKKEPVVSAAEKGNAVPEKVDRLMRLYPQYEEIYVTPEGFVHSKDAPKYVVKNAVLYKNKYYKS